MKKIDYLKLTPVYDWFKQKSFSQFGEDVAIFNFLGRKKKGFYVEVGAYHPKIFSNSYLFYKLGWSGVCVEPNPGAKWMFGLIRPRDIFVQCGVQLRLRFAQKSVLDRRPLSTSADPLRAVFARKSSVSKHFMNYYVFEDGAVNTFDKKVAKENQKVGRKLLEVVKVPVRTLGSILDEKVARKQKIDFLSVDVEGQDLGVLKSNNWKKYSPKVVVCEDLGFEIENTNKSLTVKYLKSVGYRLQSVLGPSLVFVKKPV